ncbi:8-amino-7-oxononanoate synthase [Streptomyces sp. HC44]|uniref:8-amino-7-oxononanoate synthase n=1 Tax=Streptomyces scabichelini TaxID=2711217 RepID=A0A6G4VN26_9ACTN|nr:8-amino-7-oxononanoate synthase [Streptomyces scabichelini]NGO15371.1 8-amino-7-oxononanoate synthase [Streptomyces scabichelini]
MFTLTAKPDRVEQGGRVRLTLTRVVIGDAADAIAEKPTARRVKAAAKKAGAGRAVPEAVEVELVEVAGANPGGDALDERAAVATATVTWQIDGNIIAVTHPDADAPGPWNISWDVPDNQQPTEYIAAAVHHMPGDDPVSYTDAFDVTSRPFGPGDPLQVHMRRTGTDPTDDQALWTVIRRSTDRLGFKPYADWINDIMCTDARPHVPAGGRRDVGDRSLPFPGVDAYLLLKVATEVFLLANCGVHVNSFDVPDVLGFTDQELADELRRYSTTEPGSDAFQLAIVNRWARYIKANRPELPSADPAVLPYLGVIRDKLGDQGIPVRDGFGNDCYGILREKLAFPCFLELIWNYWHEEGMLTHSVDAIARRFQNIRSPGARDPLAHVEIDPLRGLNPILWGYVQDEQHRLTALRRAHEYDHHYGINQLPPNAAQLRAADSRPRFLEAFHTLLNLASAFFREDDDTTVIADGFPVLNALKDVHLLLTEGQHNQYGDLPWTARQEMLMQQWILARPEMREFLPGRTMVAYPEAWMDRVDTMKRLQGWTPDTVIHFRDLGRFGEQLLLSVRFGNWSDISDRNFAANWARYWRTEIQGYVHSYRSVTGADLTGTPIDAQLPVLHLRRRLAQYRSGRPAMAPAAGGTAPALGRRRTAPAVQRAGSVPQLPPAQRPFGAQPASLPPGYQGVPRLPRPEGR